MAVVEPSSTITCMIAFSIDHIRAGRNCSMWRRVPQALTARIHDDQLAAALGELLEIGRGNRVVFDGLAPMTMATSAFSISLNVAVTAPEPTFSISAATEDAWHRRVQ